MLKRFALCLATASVVVGSHLRAQETDKATANEAEIKGSIESYVAAFNRGDADAVATHWSENGEFVTPSGETIRGRAAIQAAFTAYFAENKGVRVELPSATMEFLSPSVVVEKGTARMIRADQEPSESDYTAVHVKHDGKWKMDSVREADREEPHSHCEQLKGLEWMIGEWVDQDEDATVETVCQWTRNRNFITRSFKVVVADGSEIETGIYNLTKDETTALVHFGAEQTQEWLMVRLEKPEADSSEE